MKFLSITIFLLYTSLLIGQNTYLHCGKLIDTKNGKVLENMTIIIEGDKISAVEKGFKTPEDLEDSVIDLKNKTVLPGLIDMHVHVPPPAGLHQDPPRTFL